MSTAAEPPKPIALFKKRTGKANLRRRPATPDDDDDKNRSDSNNSEDENGHRIKRARKGGITAASSAAIGKGKHPIDVDSIKATKFTADRSANIQEINDATRQSDWYEQNNDDLSAKNLLGTTRTQTDPVDVVDKNGAYKGQSGYSSFIKKNPDARQAAGPKQASTNVRMNIMTDYKPDVCKDYKKTGYCGFGDSCIYLHDRSDYKQGWALDKDWETQTKGKKVKGTVIASANRNRDKDDQDQEDAAELALLEKIPFACIICKGEYKHPVVTLCSHYYCENCAIKRYKQTPNCASCGAGTKGVFNSAKNLQKLLDKKRKREERIKLAQEAEDQSE